MSSTPFQRFILFIGILVAMLAFSMALHGCSIQPPATEQPKEDAPLMIGFYPSPYDALRGNDINCNDLLMSFKGESYVASNDSQMISSYMNPCQLAFMGTQSQEVKSLIADLTSSATKEDPRLTATMMSSEDGHSLMQLRNDKMNIDVFVRTKAPEMLPRNKEFDGSYDRKKLTMPVPDFVDQLAQKLIAAGYKFNSAKAGQLQFETGSMEATSGYGTAAIMFDQTSVK